MGIFSKNPQISYHINMSRKVGQAMKDRIKVIARFRPGAPSNIYDVREGSVFVDVSIL